MAKMSPSVFADDARWDNGHAHPIRDYLRDADDPDHALEMFRQEMEDAGARAEWIDTNEEAISDVGISGEEAYRIYVDEYVEAARDDLKSIRAIPRRGIGRMSRQQWLETRRKRAEAQWPNGGAEAFERELFVRAALEDLNGDSFVQDVMSVDPSIVRSALDPALRYFITARVGPARAAPKDRAVYVFPGNEFEMTDEWASETANLLESQRGTTWRYGRDPFATGTAGYDGSDVYVFIEEGPIEKRNPAMQSSKWSGRSKGMSPADFDPGELAAGTEHELEHTTDRKVAQRIAMDHLSEDPSYYQKLKAIENPRSMMTSPSWSTARDKLRSAAQQTKKNPTTSLEGWGPFGEEAYEREMAVAVALTQIMELVPTDEDDGYRILRDPKYDATITVSSRCRPLHGVEFCSGKNDAGWGYMASWYWVHANAPKGYWNIPTNYDLLLRTRDFLNQNWAATGGEWQVSVSNVETYGGGFGRRSYARAQEFGGDFPSEATFIFNSVPERTRGRDPQKPNPMPASIARKNPQSTQLEDAKAKFEEFHRKKPTKVGEFHRDFVIPSSIGDLGEAVHVLYRSSKKDPSTGEQPKKPIDYIHEHYAGVRCYAPLDEIDQVEVPDFIQSVDALVLLGKCLGFCFRDEDGKEKDAEGEDPLPELYATPCGKALIVVQDKREVLAMIWGGGLGVWARGIDG